MQAASTLAPSAPSWAVAAKLQQSLQGSGAVSLLNAPAERRRRLALAAAVARQQVQLGVEPPTAAAAVVEPAAASTPAQGPAPQAADAVKAELGRWMERLADQNQQLQAAVVGQQEQLQKQQVRLLYVDCNNMRTTRRSPHACCAGAATAGAGDTCAGRGSGRGGTCLRNTTNKQRPGSSRLSGWSECAASSQVSGEPVALCG